MKRILSIMLCAVLAISLLSACSKSEKPLSAAELLDLGEKYLLDLDYEQAIVQFTRLTEVEPKNARAYLGVAEAHMGLGKPDKAIEVLRKGLEQLPDNAGIIQRLDDLIHSTETPQSTLDPNPFTLEDYEKIYIQYMNSNKWKDSYEPTDAADYKITAYKIFDLDGSSIPELWFHAESSDELVGPRGPERRDFFCTIEGSCVIQLLSSYTSGGTIGGDEITVYYDKVSQAHVICKTGYAGGFGGVMTWVEIYNFSGVSVTETMRYSQISQVASNYSSGELDKPGLFYPFTDITWGNEAAFTVYRIKDEQVSKEAYDQLAARFIAPVDASFRFY